SPQMLKRSSSTLSTAKITILALAGISFIGVTMESHSLTLDEACAFLKISLPSKFDSPNRR
ncbi:hypothetical protein ACV2IZ_22485, partial [Salmonella enterica subsp. enterica serovar Braenderup]